MSLAQAQRAAAVPVGILRRYGWAPAGVFLLHLFVSRVVDGYVRFPQLDIPMHFFGGVAIAYFFSGCFAALPKGAVEPAWRPFLHVVLVISMTATAAVLWEFAEFLSDALLGTHSQIDLDDTLSDMAMGITGGVTYALIAWRTSRVRRVDTQHGNTISF